MIYNDQGLCTGCGAGYDDPHNEQVCTNTEADARLDATRQQRRTILKLATERYVTPYWPLVVIGRAGDPQQRIAYADAAHAIELLLECPMWPDDQLELATEAARGRYAITTLALTPVCHA